MRKTEEHQLAHPCIMMRAFCVHYVYKRATNPSAKAHTDLDFRCPHMTHGLFSCITPASLTLKAPITTAASNIFFFQKKKTKQKKNKKKKQVFTDDSHEMSRHVFSENNKKMFLNVVCYKFFLAL